MIGAEARRWAAGVLALGLFLAGCGSGEVSEDSIATEAVAADQDPSPPTVVPSPTAVAAGPTPAPTTTQTDSNDAATPPSFPAITLTSSTGGQIDFGSLQGQDTVLWFWAPW